MHGVTYVEAYKVISALEMVKDLILSGKIHNVSIVITIILNLVDLEKEEWEDTEFERYIYRYIDNLKDIYNTKQKDLL